ncbi:TPA: AMP-binding protein [Streptococcus agalactiae]
MSKLAYVNGGTIKNLPKGNLTLLIEFEKNLVKNQNLKIHYYDKNGNYAYETYEDIKNNALSILGGLKNNSVRKGDMVIFQLSRCKDFVDLFWACQYAGAISVLANKPKNLSDINSNDCLTVVNIKKMAKRSKIVVSEDLYEEYVEFAKKVQIDVNDIISINTLKVAKINFDISNNHSEDPAIMFFTSGSTGLPKGVIQTNKAAVSRCYSHIQFHNCMKDTIMNWMPLEHAGGILMAHFLGVVSNSEQILVDTDYILENPSRWLELMEKHKVNYSWAPHFAFVMLNDLVKDSNQMWDLTSVNKLFDGGEFVHAKTAKEFLKNVKKFGITEKVLYPCWGMCETCSGTIFNNCFDMDKNSGVNYISKNRTTKVVVEDKEYSDVITEIGIPLPGIEIKIVDSNNNILEEDSIGKFLIKGDCILKEYYKNNEANTKSFIDGWLDTGDLGFIHNGKLSLTGRNKDIIIVNGLNYNCVDIEAIIEESGYVEKSFNAIISVYDAECRKEKIIAFIVPKRNLNIEDVKAEVGSIVYEKIGLNLSGIVVLDKEDIPKTNLGKIQRKKLKNNYIEGKYDFILGSLELKIKELEKKINERLNGAKVLTSLISKPLPNITIEFEHINQEENISEESLNELLRKYENYLRYKIYRREKIYVFIEMKVKNIFYKTYIFQKIEKELSKNKETYIVEIIPVDGLTNKTTEKLYESYKNGEYDDNLNIINYQVKSRKNVPDWFFEERLVKVDDWIPSVINSKTFINKIFVIDDEEKILNIASNDIIANNYFVIDRENYRGLITNNIYIVESYYDNDMIKVIDKNKLKNNEVIFMPLKKSDFSAEENLSSAMNMLYKVSAFIKLIKNCGLENLNMTLITKDALSIGNNDNNNFCNSILNGYVRSAQEESCNIRYLDFDKVSYTKENIFSEISNFEKNNYIYRQNNKYTIETKQIKTKKSILLSQFKNNEFYVIVGGTGGIGRIISEFLIEKYNSKILIYGRDNLDENCEKKLFINKLSEKGVIEYSNTKLDQELDIEGEIYAFESKHDTRLAGIINLSGNIEQSMVYDQTLEDLDEFIKVKARTTLLLANIVSKRKDVRLILTSSARVIKPGICNSTYCSGCEFNRNISAYLKNKKDIESICISWSQWSNTGMNKNLETSNMLLKQGFMLIEPVEGINSMFAAVAMANPDIIVGIDRNVFVKEHFDRFGENKIIEIKISDNLKEEHENLAEIIESEIKRMDLKYGYLIQYTDIFEDTQELVNKLDFDLYHDVLIKPSNEVETRLLKCWSKVFNKDNIGVNDRFFELGGDSIKLFKLMSFIKEEFRVNIKSKELFKLQTIEKQAELINEKLG